MIDERFLDIRDKVNSIDFRGIKEAEKIELESFETTLNTEIERYYNIYNRVSKEDILVSKLLTKGVKNKLTNMLSLLYKIEELNKNCENKNEDRDV